MRKLLIVAISLFISFSAIGQITLEKTYSTTSTDVITYSLYPIDKYMYYTIRETIVLKYMVWTTV
jgi:hypothetical protein